MFSKETAVLIPILILFYYLLVNNFKIRAVIKKTLFIIFVFAIPAFIYLILRFGLSPVKSTGEISLSAFFQNLNIPFEYIAKMFYLFGFSQLSMTNPTLVIWGALISAVILLLVIFNKNIDNKLILLGLIFFIVFVLPPLFVRMPASDGEFNYIDCRFYLPFIGFLIIFAAIIRAYKSSAFWKKKSSKTVLTVLVSVFFVYVLVFNLTENQYYRNGKVFWSNVLKIYPGRATYWMGLGYYYFDQKDYLKAAACAEKAISLKPEITEYYQKASLAYDKAGSLKKSNGLLEKLLLLDKDNTRNYLLLIRNNLRLGNYDEAVAFKNDLEKLPVADLKKKSDVYSSAASYFIYSHKYNPAIELLNKVTDIQPDNPSHMNDLGVCFYYTGKIDSAKKYFSNAVKLDPSNKEFQKNLHLVNR
jgi:Flp pilus assembly protein TadD